MSEIQISNIIKQNYPKLEDEILSYVENIIMENSELFETVEELKESIEGVLNDCDSTKSDNQVLLFCEEIYNLLPSKIKNFKPILLKNPISIFDLSELQKIEYNNNKIKDLGNVFNTGNDLIDEKIIEENMAKVEEKKLKKLKKKEVDMHTLLISQQFSKNVILYDNNDDDNEEISNTTLTNVSIESFDMSFGGKMLLKDATLSVAIGRRYGFIGRNGLGKTTLLKAIAIGELKIPAKISILLVEQEVIGDGTKAIDSVLEADKIRNKLLNELAELTANKANDHENADRVLQIYHKLELIESDKAPAKASCILSGLGFSPEMQLMTTSQFSGGWRMRLSLARALFSQPDLLLLDEPTNMLDIKAIIWLEEYLKKWPKSLIVVSHDQSFLDAVATDIFYLANQKIEHSKCNYSLFEQERQNRLINQIKEYETQKEYREHIQRFIDRFRTYAARAAQVQSKIKMLEKLPKLEPVEKEIKVTFEFPPCSQLPSPVIQTDELCFSYDGQRQILNNLEINVGSHSRVCIVGENGAGKTTLLKILNHEFEPTSGMLKNHKNLRVGYFSQHHVDQLELKQSSLEFLKSKFPGFDQEYYRGRLGNFGIIGEVALRPIYSLSGGQKSRVAFTILSMRNPNFLILDEPTNHLDMQTIGALGEAIKRFEGGVILVSHDERLINNVCQELWMLEKSGKLSIVEGGIKKYKEMVQKELESY